MLKECELLFLLPLRFWSWGSLSHPNTTQAASYSAETPAHQSWALLWGLWSVFGHPAAQA